MVIVAADTDPLINVADIPASAAGRTAFLRRLEKSIAATTRSRFIASKRLEQRDQRTSWLVAMASTYTIVLTVLPYFVMLPIDTCNIFNLSTVGLSMITLVGSLFVASRRDAVNSEQNHRSALELNELNRKIGLTLADTDNGKQINYEDLLGFNAQYSQVLQKYSVNHDEIDFLAVLLSRPEENPWLKGRRRILISARIVVVTKFSAFAMMVLTGFVGWLVFFYALPMRLPRT